VIGPPRSTTSIPRGKPSVESIATARTRSSPRCRCTSAINSRSSNEMRSALLISGSEPRKRASMTTPWISITLPTF
jgi:hypothetical protein